ncbi:MAG: NUDIX domain-containing protein [Ruminococcaceae bacterium]|nr:NUDIX domain-containing protein [Oscillospiraceae bacterium]
MDLTFKTDSGVFNYRVCAIIIHDSALLATKNKRTPYYYLPGGRVKMHETAEAAIKREIFEELGIHGKIIRPLWLNQGFFTEDVTKEKFHELCIYYLIDISETNLLSRGESFVMFEGEKRHFYEWIPLSRLKDEYIYPLFVKDQIYDLPRNFTILEEYE